LDRKCTRAQLSLGEADLHSKTSKSSSTRGPQTETQVSTENWFVKQKPKAVLLFFRHCDANNKLFTCIFYINFQPPLSSFCFFNDL